MNPNNFTNKRARGVKKKKSLSGPAVAISEIGSIEDLPSGPSPGLYCFCSCVVITEIISHSIRQRWSLEFPHDLLVAIGIQLNILWTTPGPRERENFRTSEIEK